MVDVGGCDEFESRAIKLVSAGGKQIGILRWGEEVYALLNVCPHQAGPVCTGFVRPKLIAADGKPGQMAIDPETPAVACPWHKWEFDARTGKSFWDPRYRVKTYPAKVVGNRIMVSIGSSPAGGRSEAGHS